MTNFHNGKFNDTELFDLLNGFGFGFREALIFVTLNSIGKAMALELSSIISVFPLSDLTRYCHLR
jgi:hypothetical protein